MSNLEVLLVEDSVLDAELTLRALSRKRLANKVVHVSDGQEALEYLNFTGRFSERPRSNPRLVLLDLKLPKVDGLEVLRELRANPATKDIPVVILTSSRQDKDIETAYKLGVNSYIVKPVAFENFADAVTNLGFYWLLLNEPPPVQPA